MQTEGDDDEKVECAGRPAFAAILGSVFAFPAYAKEKTFPDGIYAGDFALGGLTKEQAEEQFASYVSALEERSITLDVVGNKVETTAKDLGYACANTDALQEAEEYAGRRLPVRRTGAQGSGKRTGAHFSGSWSR